MLALPQLRQRLTLLFVRTLVDVEGELPVTVGQVSGRIKPCGDIQATELHVAQVSLFYMPCREGLAVAMRRIVKQ